MTEQTTAKEKAHNARVRRAWNAAHREEYLAYYRGYRKNRKEETKKANRKHYAANRERYLREKKVDGAAWRAANPFWNLIVRHRAAWNYYYGLSEMDICEMLKRQSNKCVGCLSYIDCLNCSIDHIVALIRGGKETMANLQLLCWPCNRIKGQMDMPEFIQHCRRIDRVHRGLVVPSIVADETWRLRGQRLPTMVTKRRLWKVKYGLAEDDIGEMLVRQYNACRGCASSLNVLSCSPDHVVALSGGGRTDMGNFQLLCVPCNRGKGPMGMREFMEHAGLVARANKFGDRRAMAVAR